MAHEVKIQINENIILHKDAVVEVRKNGSLLGEILISKGNIEWRPAGNSVNYKRLQWSAFASFMEEYGENIRK